MRCNSSTIIQGLPNDSLSAVVGSVKVLAVHILILNLDTTIELIRCFPCLEKLYIQSVSGDKNLWQRKHRNLISCLDIRLSIIVLESYRGIRAQVNFATFFVLNVKVLELMRFQVDAKGYYQGFEAEQRRQLQLERGLQECISTTMDDLRRGSLFTLLGYLSQMLYQCSLFLITFSLEAPMRLHCNSPRPRYPSAGLLLLFFLLILSSERLHGSCGTLVGGGTRPLRVASLVAHCGSNLLHLQVDWGNVYYGRGSGWGVRLRELFVFRLRDNVAQSLTPCSCAVQHLVEDVLPGSPEFNFGFVG